MSDTHGPRLRRIPLGRGIFASLLAGVVAVGAALMTGPNGGDIMPSVEMVASAGGTLLGIFAAALPLGYAFGAGMVSAMNRCGIALLPAYIGFYLGAGDEPDVDRSAAKRLWRTVHVSVLISLGFVVLFGIAVAGLGLATSALVRYFPWLGLLVGILLIAGGGQAVEGRALYASFGERLAERFGLSARNVSSRGYLAYGLAYGLASLRCTLPVFLAVVGSTLTVQGFVTSLIQFILYGLGMGLVVTVLTVGVAFFKHAAAVGTRNAARYVQSTTAVLIRVAGAYIVYYWLTLGGLLRVRV